MNVTYLKKTQSEVVVKVFGNSGDATIPLAELVSNGEEVSGTPFVQLAGVTWTGHYNTVMTISRNGTTFLTLPATGASFLNFSGQDLPPDNSNGTSDFVVTITGGVGQVWLKLKKVAGFSQPDWSDLTIWDNEQQWDGDLMWE